MTTNATMTRILYSGVRHCTSKVQPRDTAQPRDVTTTPRDVKSGDVTTTPRDVKSRDVTTTPRDVITTFVPAHHPASQDQISRLSKFLQQTQKLFVLTGAGISTGSGIPDYRSEGVGLYATSKNRPVQYQDFVKNASVRQRYWARNYVSWPRFSSFEPNTAHSVLAEWERRGLVHWLVTQNVDRLHQKAGAQRVSELHGTSYVVRCLSCDLEMDRHQLQNRIRSENPEWHVEAGTIAPDGDVQLTPEQIQGFKMCPCPSCGGALIPRITFFGDNVARPLVEEIVTRLTESDAMLVVGSSLQVYSGYRFALKAQELGKPLAIVNIGPTRADKLAQLRVAALCSDVLQQVDQKIR